MRLIQQQATTVQILAYISLCPASVSALYVSPRLPHLTPMPQSLTECRVILAGRIELIAPNAALGWILLFGVIVSPIFLVLHQMNYADIQPLGLTAQYTLTYTTQRVPATQVAIVQYSGVSLQAHHGRVVR